jgi:glycerol-3-phosphate acyltransferase PlsX
MSNTKTIALDAMGGDHGPEAVIPGAALALDMPGKMRFLLAGDQARIKPVLDRHKNLIAASEIIHTEDIVAPDEKPSVALRTGRGSSMRLAINAVDDGLAGSAVSGGNTGALMAMAKFVLKTLPGIHRPAIASVFPTMKNDVVMLDLGANIECSPDNLVQFAVLGCVYARMRGAGSGRNELPSVGLLNVGTEDMKGHEEVRAAGEILRTLAFPGRFEGFIEGNDIPGGTVDVVVTDGFTGNVALKVAEGMGVLTGQFVRDAFMSSLPARLGGLLAYPAMKRLKRRVDPRNYNGGMFLGLGGVCVKSHGSSDAQGFASAIRVADNLAQAGYLDRVAEEMNRIMDQEPPPQAKEQGQEQGEKQDKEMEVTV